MPGIRDFITDLSKRVDDVKTNIHKKAVETANDVVYKNKARLATSPLRTIRMTNGNVVEARQNKSNGSIYWFKNGKPLSKNETKNYKFYDKKSGIVRELNWYNSKGSSETPVADYYSDILGDAIFKDSYNKQQIEREYSIPSSGKYITLRTKGNMNLADIPLNLLDSIAINAGRSNTNFFKDAALVGKEDTFGNISKALGRPGDGSNLTPHELTNNHAYYDNPYLAYQDAIYKKYYSKMYGEDDIIKAEKDIRYALNHGLIKPRTKQYHVSPLADAFARYNDNPSGYNPGQSNYTTMIDNIEQELRGEPQLVNYWITRGTRFYNRGKKEFEGKRMLETRGKLTK